jgi:hypothetical protein
MARLARLKEERDKDTPPPSFSSWNYMFNLKTNVKTIRNITEHLPR